jgi:predicted MPP superfamily phosphohydrolase
MVILSLVYIFGMLVLRGNYSNFSRWVLGLGISWVVILIYSFVFFVSIDIIRFIARFIRPLNLFMSNNSRTLILLSGILLIFIIICVFVIGIKMANTPKVTSYEVVIPKKIQGMNSMKIVFASDIHLGMSIGRERLKEMIDKINSLNPNLVLLGGDIIDGDAVPFIKESMGEEFKRLKPDLGLYGILGNHEYYGRSLQENITALKDSGINMLIDEKVLINEAFYIIGRDDRSGNRNPERKRKSLSELMKDINYDKPIILLDHQPFELIDASSNFVDLQLSGHTHNGQFWPINLITKSIYEIDWGQKIKDKTNIIVSCGAGTWGPQIRLGSYSEIVEINIKFAD